MIKTEVSMKQFKETVQGKLDTIYENLKASGDEPIKAFRDTPRILKRQVEEIIDEYWEWDSDWK